MKFYPDIDLYKYYFKALQTSDWFSHRIQDKTARVTVDGINRAINICERNETFLDFGAGGGRYSAALLSFFGGGYGIEIEKNSSLEALAKTNSHFTTIYGKHAVSKIKRNVDFIQLIDVIEHIPTDEVNALVKSFSQLQEKGGVIYVLTPNAIRCGVVSRSGIFYKRFKYGHRKHYLLGELDLLFSKYGYTKIMSSYEDFALRSFARRAMLGCSMIDRKLLGIPLYRQTSSPFILFLNVCFSAINVPIVWFENVHRNDSFFARTVTATFKKLG